MSNYWKKKLEELNAENKAKETSSNNTGNSSNYWQNKIDELDKADDIAPVKPTAEKEDKRKWYDGFLQLGDALSDGFQIMDIPKTLFGTDADIATNLISGVAGWGEDIVDAGATGLGMLSEKMGWDGTTEKLKEFAKKDLYDEKEISRKILSHSDVLLSATPLAPLGNAFSTMFTIEDWLNPAKDDNSVLGDTSDSLIQSGGEMVAKMGMPGKGFLTVGDAITGVTVFGEQAEQALKEDATFMQAGGSGLISAGAEIMFEKLSGGIKLGGKTVDEGLTRILSKNISNVALRNTLNFVKDVGGEAFEEFATEFVSKLGTKLYKEEDLGEILWSEDALVDYIQAAIGGGLMSGAFNASNAVSSTKKGRDYKTGLTNNEQTVVDKVYNDLISEAEADGKKLTAKEKNEIHDEVMNALERGEIDIDDIEAALGGATYKTYRETVDSEDALQKEFDELGALKKSDLTVKQDDRYNELKQLLADAKTNNAREQLKAKLSDEVFNLAKDSRLAESYNERARRSQAFEADVNQYKNEYAKKTVQNALDFVKRNKGAMHNGIQAHDFIDLCVKIAEGKSKIVDFTTIAELENSIKNGNPDNLQADPKRIEAFNSESGNKLVINMDVNRSLTSLVGHEITDMMRGAKAYSSLQKAAFSYAETKGELETRRSSVARRYKNVNADIDGELTSDLCGDYLFTDREFIQHLSVNHRNVFQKVFDEIKYLWNLATAGSKEKRELERVKHEFEKVWRDNAKSDGKATTETKYSLGYHAGDLGKAESYGEQGYYRGTGHFGTGTYFVGDEAKISDSHYGKRPHHAVEFDNYNLYKIRNDDDGYKLHKQLKAIDGGITAESLEAVKADKFQVSDLRHEAWERTKKYEVEEYDDELGFSFSTNYIDASTQAYAEVAAENGIEFVTYDEWLSDQSDDVPKQGDPDYDYYKSDYLKYLQDAVEKVDDQKNGNYGRIRDAYFGLWLRFGKEQVNRALQSVVEYDSEMNQKDSHTQYRSDSLATVFMKSLGYEGIDTRGTALDNTEYGSVIYDLKGEDLARKQAIGTAKYSLSDSDGKQLTKEQSEYFKDSKMRDENGNLKVMYHGSQDAGFHVFDPAHSDDETSLFFVDRNDVAASYSGTSETYEAQTIRTAEDMNKFIESIGVEGYEVIEENGEFTLEYEGDYVASSKTAQGIYEEFCWYEGVGEGDANYKVYLNLTNPLVVDAEGRNWNRISREYSQKLADRYNSLTAEEKETLVQLASWEDISIFRDELRQALADTETGTPGSYDADFARNVRSAYEKLGGNKVNMYDLFTIASDGFSAESINQFAVKQMNTRDYAQRAKEQGYDGVIFNNIVDVGGYGNGSEGASTVAIAFDSNQIKSVANEKPTRNADIRYSLSEDSKGRQISPAVQKRFGNSKVVDDSGNLKVVYHGTAMGEFSIFDKSKGSVEGDFGSGFYFTDNETDVSDHYEGGGPDFDNKVARRAEQIEAEEEIDYDEAEKRAREELYKGSHKFEVYLNIENPAIVGETMLLTKESYLEQYNEDDYDDYDDYIGDVEQLLADDVENIVWEVERNTGAYSTDGIAGVLYDAYYEGGIGIEELKSKINDLYLEDENGNLIGNEVTRQIIESLGYDGIVDPTVSGKWNMDIEYGTTHYIVFKPNQIKSVTNQNPTDNPDIHNSLSAKDEAPVKYGNFNIYAKDLRLEKASAQEDIAPVAEEAAPVAETVADILPDDVAPISEEEANAMQNERIASLDDADAPPEVEAPTPDALRDAITLNKNELRQVTSAVNNLLGLDAEDTAKMENTIQRYAQNPNMTGEDLFEEISREYKYTEEYSDPDDTVQQAKNHLRGVRIYVPEQLKAEFDGKRKDGFNQFRKEHFGHFYLTTKEGANALKIDQVYQELTELFPGIFPEGVWNPADQLHLMGDLANFADETDYAVSDYDSETIQEVCDVITNGVDRYAQEGTLRLAEETRKSMFASDDFAPSEDDIVYVDESKGDTTTAFDTAKRGQIDGQQTMFKESTTPTKEQPIKSVKDRLESKLHHTYGELSHNKRLRREAIESFNRKIDALQLEYDNKKNKDTKVANNTLRSIERYTRLRDDVDADYTKRINDLRKKVDKYKEKVDEGFDDTEGRAMRSEIHAQKVDAIKAKFSEKGLDFDSVLKGAKNLSTLATVDNTPQRVMEKTLGYKAGQILADETVNKEAQNETDGIKWLNSITSRKGNGGLLKQLSEKYHIKPGSKESAAAQMYAEGFYVNDNGDRITYGDEELAKDFPNAETRKNIKGLVADARIRDFYDSTLAKINESRTRNAYPEIKPLDNYYLHFRAMDDTFSRLGIPFNPNDIKAKDLPTDLNGVTADLKPGQPYFASAMHRRGNKTSYDLLGGIERYATGAKNQIYHIDDIQTLRAVRNYIVDLYGQGKGLENLDSLSEEEAQDRIDKVYGSHLSTFAKFLNEEANVIAGKTALIDRGIEGIIGRRGITFIDTINKQVGSNMVGLNVSSSLTNFLAGVQAIAKTNKLACVKSLAQTTTSRIGSIFGKTDSFVENNPTIIRRKGADRFYRTPFQKVADSGYVLMQAVDSVTTEFIVRAKYNEFIKKGMSEQDAIVEADKWTSRLMGDRSLGQMPQLYNSKMLGLITKFQLEVRNQLDSQFYDTIQEAKVSNEEIKNKAERNAKTAAKVTATLFELAVLQHLFGKGFEAVAGYNPAFDIISVLATLFGFDDDEESEDTALDNIEQGFLELLEDLPYTSVLTGGRIPISSALPIEELIKGEDEYGNEKSRLGTLGEVAPYYVLPTGYGQIKKTIQGLSMFSDEHPVSGSYTDSGNLRFPVDETVGNVAQAAIFGQWANKNAREYFDNDIAPLNEKQTQEYIDAEMPIQDYWDYRKGLKGLSTLEEKAEYISDLDLSDEQKNILINNIANRKDDLDMSDYDDYENFDEFDYASKYPNKHAFLKDNGISYAEYNSSKESREAYNWAYNNPEEYTLSKAVSSDVVTYRRYASELYDIKADKDEDGKSIQGSRKEKVIEYINNLDADYGEKIILFKHEYPADDSYNDEIVEYLNERNDISYDDMVAILLELGFTVKGDSVTWD